ncbi:hypothetical protein LB452_12265 [Psychroflexus sp. CAK8W]|uniref:HU domain-containing protein n=1 Tax=Psychroflexus longus TaxID=2873596 RepID=A0ABS7XL70_9FLAO|nr:hypothetical protein [Psychroflexus longus]MBZ9779698.1 hypothetical protein [Psychroflexus longus]
MNDFITCTISKRGNGVKADPSANYHLKAVYNRSIGMDELARRISNKCTLNTSDVIGCLNALNEEILFQLKDGNKVDLGWLGSLKIGLEAKAHSSPIDCKVSDIKRVKINYQPNKNLKRELKHTTNFKIDPKAKLKYIEP